MEYGQNGDNQTLPKTGDCPLFWKELRRAIGEFFPRVRVSLENAVFRHSRRDPFGSAPALTAAEGVCANRMGQARTTDRLIIVMVGFMVFPFVAAGRRWT